MFANGAVDAVGPDDIAGPDGFAVVEGCRDAVLILVDAGYGLGPDHFGAQFVESLLEQLLGVGLRDHQRVRILGRQGAEVDRDQHARPLPHAEARRDEAGLYHAPGHVEVFQNFQRAGIYHGRAGGVLAL